MNQFYFQRIIEKIQYNFIPVYNIEDNSILGYKIIKDFTPVGFNDKELMYQIAYEKGIFEEFVLALLNKAYTIAIEKRLDSYLLFYTLRMNYVNNEREFFTKINNIVKKLKINSSNLIFDIKSINNWHSFYDKVENIYTYKNILKANVGEKISIKAIKNSKTTLLEFKSLENFKNIKSELPQYIKILFNLTSHSTISIEELKQLGINYYYSY